MKITIALLRGVMLGLMVVGAAYFLKNSYGPIQDALVHIPEIIFEGYQPTTLSEGFSSTFCAWVAIEAVLMMLIPGNSDSEES